MQVCAAKAITKRKHDGVVIVDRTACTGDRKCLEVCPFGAPQFATDGQREDRTDDWRADHPMQKCTFCIDRLEMGKKPACVDACITRALDSGSETEIRRKYPEAIRTATGLPDSKLKPDGTILTWGDTKPSVYFKPKSPKPFHR
jgi:anaerobic dimethyl sulfoxide reductase subunit B (iron-sulfur subunit)